MTVKKRPISKGLTYMSLEYQKERRNKVEKKKNETIMTKISQI